MNTEERMASRMQEMAKELIQKDKEVKKWQQDCSDLQNMNIEKKKEIEELKNQKVQLIDDFTLEINSYIKTIASLKSHLSTQPATDKSDLYKALEKIKENKLGSASNFISRYINTTPALEKGGTCIRICNCNYETNNFTRWLIHIAKCLDYIVPLPISEAKAGEHIKEAICECGKNIDDNDREHGMCHKCKKDISK